MQKTKKIVLQEITDSNHQRPKTLEKSQTHLYVQQWGFYQLLQIAAVLLRAEVKVELKY